MIELWPAIDLIDNQSVRLTEGVYETKELMPRAPLEAIRYYSQFKQVTRIHIVDLMGALHQKPTEEAFIKELIKESDVPIEIGGGIRSQQTIDYYLSNGASYVIVGTRGLQDPEWLQDMTNRYPGKIYLGLDAKKTKIAINGWTETEEKTIYDVAKETASYKLGGIIYTDISKDGKMAGPNVALTKELVDLSPHPITASGGIRHIEDLRRLEEVGVTAAIVGKAANTAEFWEAIR